MVKVYTSCSEVREDFSALLDDELEQDERDALEVHLAGCSECLRELDCMKQVDILYHALPKVNAPANFDERLKSAMRPALLRFPAARRASRYFAPALAAAAVLLMVGGISYFALPSRNASPVGDLAKLSAPSDETSRILSEATRAYERAASQESMLSFDGFDNFDSNKSDADAPATADAPTLESLADAANALRSRLKEFSPPAPMMQRPVFTQSEARARRFRDATQPIDADPAFAQAFAMREGVEESLHADAEVAENEILRFGSQIAIKSPEHTQAARKTVATNPPPASSLPLAVGLVPDDFAMSRAELASPDLAPVSESAASGELVYFGTPTAGRGRLDRPTVHRSREHITLPAEKKAGSAIVIRALERRDSVWYQKGYVDAPIHAIARDSAAFRAMRDADADLARFAQLDDAVVFKFGERWFRLAPVQR